MSQSAFGDALAALFDSLAKGLDVFISVQMTEGEREVVMRQVALEYNWRHPYRKISWRRLNRRQRAEAARRLTAGFWSRMETGWDDYWGIE